MKIVFLACAILVLAVTLTGIISYFVTRSAVVDKLKNRDLIYIAESIASKVDDRLERAKETARLLAQDPAVMAWLVDAERNEQLGEYSKQKLDDIASRYDYANSFIVSRQTGQYWAERHRMLQIMKPHDPDSRWFYDALQSQQPVSLNIDYNIGRQETFVFVNALIGEATSPLGVAGVGLSIQYIAAEFQKYKEGSAGRLWLIDRQGKILLSDQAEQNGYYLNDFIPPEILAQLLQHEDRVRALDYQDSYGQIMDLVGETIQSGQWLIVYQVPREESIGFLNTIKWNGAIASCVALLVMILLFYIVAHKIADPLKRAIALTELMEQEIADRTEEISEQNTKILDSIDYAKRLQESILARPDELQTVLKDYFILWQPRDLVGGDFYWVRQIDAKRSLVAIADCTGHGVPGAFMTMAVNSVLTQLAQQQDNINPALILQQVNQRMREILHRNKQNKMTDDGLDMALCYIEAGKKLLFAGAHLPLYIYRRGEVQILPGDRQSLGYERAREDFPFTVHSWDISPGDRFYLTTDGYLDQNGGKQDFSFGKRRFIQLLTSLAENSIDEQKDAIVQALAEYSQGQPQRDDITVIGFSFDSIDYVD
ncbi:MAG: SpoIIE family protein phosphatase [Sporomusaceae bacterium]|nr:SpoIIE family protein phosphatase [Sporomusaceae bacterium]